MPNHARKYVAILLLICLPLSIPAVSFAQKEEDPRLQGYLQFEKNIFEIIATSVQPLSTFNEEINEEELYTMITSAKNKFIEGSEQLAELNIPSTLPDDIKLSLNNVKKELSIGFKILNESLFYFSEYIRTRDPNLHRKYITKRNQGFLYIDGGLTSLATVRLRLNAPKKAIPNTWQVGKGYFYRLEKVIPIKSKIK
ncbi:hypothetical protein [Heyndrickxia vini]|uniref:Uncharacterized protein n=1 Tax=Heyndrickxia vini TaxID=1476025 RepID=A0ABX7E2L6_9BACI|nr:hypothetical protein [Heyndrickxia vini]QQZ09968.1 hypothetical protein I5776_03060 [Heyndrickxia vini]